MDSLWARDGRSQANLPRCLVFYLLLSAAAEGRPDERLLTEVDKEYIAPGVPIANELRQKCHGIGQFEPLKGEWVSLSSTFCFPPFCAISGKSLKVERRKGNDCR